MLFDACVRVGVRACESLFLLGLSRFVLIDWVWKSINGGGLEQCGLRRRL